MSTKRDTKPMVLLALVTGNEHNGMAPEDITTILGITQDTALEMLTALWNEGAVECRRLGDGFPSEGGPGSNPALAYYFRATDQGKLRLREQYLRRPRG